MSIHHHHSADSGQTPVVLPLAVITVDTCGILTVTLDGADYPPPPPTTPWSKARFADLLDALTLDRTRTIRVEVHESDGSTFTDIIHAAPTLRAPRSEETAEAPRRARHRHTPEMMEVTGGGFTPGEDVTIALTHTTTEVTAAGTAHATLNLGELPADGAEILLIGTTSARVVVRRVP
ncbi:hypothetical protein [Propionibacterium freudenreichii]|uniref:hypothetical protein n=1 Tax=Propionibacterium freudenreichii TaxID=1744 RepID=UPI00254AD003|nr:hypothetical protein [Propionibacterium freudenreichii]MDK9640972.1 hypothetical protein [Propionibacterium freudenreichii]